MTFVDGEYAAALGGSVHADRISKAWADLDDPDATLSTSEFQKALGSKDRNEAREAVKWGIANGQLEKIGSGNATRYRRITSNLTPV